MYCFLKLLSNACSSVKKFFFDVSVPVNLAYTICFSHGFEATVFFPHPMCFAAYDVLFNEKKID